MLSAIRANELEYDLTRGIANREAADEKLENFKINFHYYLLWKINGQARRREDSCFSPFK
jgi:hypothetical protein